LNGQYHHSLLLHTDLIWDSCHEMTLKKTSLHLHCLSG